MSPVASSFPFFRYQHFVSGNHYDYFTWCWFGVPSLQSSINSQKKRYKQSVNLWNLFRIVPVSKARYIASFKRMEALHENDPIFFMQAYQHIFDEKLCICLKWYSNGMVWSQSHLQSKKRKETNGRTNEMFVLIKMWNVNNAFSIRLMFLSF